MSENTVPKKRKKEFNLESLKQKKLLTREEAAFMIGISPSSMQKLMHEPEFPSFVKIGYRAFVDRESLDHWLGQQTGNFDEWHKEPTQSVHDNAIMDELSKLNKRVSALCKQFNVPL